MGSRFDSKTFAGGLVCIALAIQTTSVSLSRIRSPFYYYNGELLPVLIPSTKNRSLSYGAHGSTAAEFIVGAGLDTRKFAIRVNRKTSDVEHLGTNRIVNFPPGKKRRIQPFFSYVTPVNDKNRISSFVENSSKTRLINVIPYKKSIANLRFRRDLNVPQIETHFETSWNETNKANLNNSRNNEPVEFHELQDDYSRQNRSKKNLSLNLMSIIAQADNSSKKAEVQYTSTSNDASVSKVANITAPILRHLVLSHLVETVLKIRNSSFHHDDANNTSPELSSEEDQESMDNLTPAEQRQFGIIVNPYSSVTSLASTKLDTPVIRILKGKLVPLPQLPPELIPIILGTYNPTYAEDDPKLTESILDSAIYTLLQNEDLLNLGMINPQTNSVPPSNVLNRKSPSTNFVGSMKSSEPVIPKSPYSSYKPGVEYMPEWRPGPRCDRLTEEICLDDSDYPSSAIMSSIYKDKAKFDLMYAEVKERESQVDGLSRKQEQSYTFDHYFGATSYGSAIRPLDYGPRGGFVCPSEVHYAKPHRAKNRKGEWKVVVNVAEYTQTLRMEKCLAAGNPCKYVVSHMQSTCSQVYNYHRLLVFNKEQGLHIDAFRVPTACACHIRGHSYRFSQPHPPYRTAHDEYGGHVESAPVMISENVPIVNKKKNSFSNTLWAILGGGQQAGTLAQSPQFLDEVRKQISWTQQMKQFPQLLKHVSPAQVLKQLLEDDEGESISRNRQPNGPIQRYKYDPIHSGAFATSHNAVSVAFKEPPATVLPVEPKKPIFIGSNVGGSNPQNVVNIPNDRQTIFAAPENPSSLNTKKVEIVNVPLNVNVEPHVPFKIQPGMHLPTNGNFQIDEDELIPIPSLPAQFSEVGVNESPFRAVLKPVLVAKTSRTKTIETDDIADIKKAVDNGSSHILHIEAIPETNEKDTDEKYSKINFSYHPILEYLSM